MKRALLILALLLLALLVGSVASQAQGGSYELTWWTVDGGGGESSGGSYILAGTIGQPDVGPALTGGDYTLIGGFWYGAGPAAAPGTHPIYLPLVVRNFSG